ncbi:hypothetical protein [Streptomyces collinus]|uniref:hypothetical protein n=1 Tax=Streptomyces collinus TaxID=42684 RepID=UPI003810C7AB
MRSLSSGAPTRAGRPPHPAHQRSAEELAGARVVHVTRLPTPPRTPGSAHEGPAVWADAELAGWWPEAVRALCARLEEDFKACSSRRNRSYLRRRHIRHAILERKDQRANRQRRGSAGGRPELFGRGRKVQ